MAKGTYGMQEADIKRLADIKAKKELEKPQKEPEKQEKKSRQQYVLDQYKKNPNYMPSTDPKLQTTRSVSTSQPRTEKKFVREGTVEIPQTKSQTQRSAPVTTENVFTQPSTQQELDTIIKSAVDARMIQDPRLAYISQFQAPSKPDATFADYLTNAFSKPESETKGETGFQTGANVLSGIDKFLQSSSGQGILSGIAAQGDNRGALAALNTYLPKVGEYGQQEQSQKAAYGQAVEQARKNLADYYGGKITEEKALGAELRAAQRARQLKQMDIDKDYGILAEEQEEEAAQKAIEEATDLEKEALKTPAMRVFRRRSLKKLAKKRAGTK